MTFWHGRAEAMPAGARALGRPVEKRRIPALARKLLRPGWMLRAASAVTTYALLGLAGEAAAQPFVDLGQDARSDDSRRPEDGINRKNCLEAETWQFEYSCSLCANVAVWLGDNCEVAENRTGAAPTCREVVPLSTAPATLQELVLDAGQFADPFDDTHVACPEVDTTTSVYVLDLTDTSDDAAAFMVFDVLVDTDPPPAPTDVEAAAGEENVTVSWTADAGEVQDRDAFQVLCFPHPGDPAATGDPDAGTGDCGLGGFVEGEEANPDDFCGAKQAATARSVRIDGLENGGSYAFGVVAYDDFQNPSLVSSIACESPRPVEDFYEAYRGAGGSAGGGFCTFAPGAARAAPPAIPLALLAFVLLRPRRR